MEAFLLVHGDREYVRRPGDELQTDLGVLDVPEDVSHGDELETHIGEPFTVPRETSSDELEALRSRLEKELNELEAEIRR